MKSHIKMEGYSMKHLRRFTAVLLVLASLMGLCTMAFAAKSFDYDDYAPTDWFFRYVEKATDAGWMNGVGEKRFDPNGTLNRAMFVTILHRIAGTPAPKKAAGFSDAVKGSWYENAVNWAAENGVVNGYADGRFGVADPLTREQMAAILFRYAKLRGMDVSVGENTNILSYSDAFDISEYAVEAFQWACGAGVISGSGDSLMPKGLSTRAQAATVLVRFDSAEESATLTRGDLEKALVETAWAYFLKDTKIQYDSENITAPILNKYYSGSYRLTEDVAPEFGTGDNTIFSVCSDYTQKVYYNGLGERFLGYGLDWVTTAIKQNSYSVYGNKTVAVAAYLESDKWGANYENRMTPQELRTFLANWKQTMRPGDVIVPAGHAMLYMGDGLVTDCWGGKYSMATGADQYETKGAVCTVHTVEDCYLEGDDLVTGTSYMLKESGEQKLDYFIILRPLNAIVENDGDADPGNDRAVAGTSIPAATYSRLAYPGMEIDRTVNITPFGTAVEGETLTYSVKVSNKSNNRGYLRLMKQASDYKGLTVTETVPAGTEFVSATEGGKLENGRITWTVDVAAGETKDLRYTVKVTAKAGEDIVSGGGFVADIPSNTIINRVGGKKLSTEEQALLSEFYHRYNQDWVKTYGFKFADDTSAAEEIYAKVLGKKLEIPNGQTLFTEIFEQVHINKAGGIGYQRGIPAEAWLYTPKASAYSEKPMLVRRYLGGKSTWFGSDQQRINEFSERYLEPGDVLVDLELSEYPATGAARKVVGTKVTVWLGEGQYAMYDSRTGELTRGRGDNELWKALISDAFFVLRPSQAGALADSGKQVKPTEEVVYAAETKEQRQAAVVASVKAMLRKGALLQYDQIAMSKVSSANGGNVRNQYFAAPESVTADKNWYGSIHALVLTVFKDAMDYEITPTSTGMTYSRMPGVLDDNTRALAWTPDDGAAPKAADIIAKLEPADVLLAVQDKSNYLYGIYLGDGELVTYVIDSSKRYDLKKGVEKSEENGAASAVQVSSVLTDEFISKASGIYIGRFVDAPEYDISTVTPQAVSRIQYPEMTIDRTVNVGPFGMAVKGGEMTYTVVIQNHSKTTYKGLPVTETVPKGTELKEAKDAKNENGKLSWTVEIPAGGSKTLSYTVTVTGKEGEKIVSDGGFVADIPSNSLVTAIGYPMPEGAETRMQELAKMSGEEAAAKLGLADKKPLDDIRCVYSYILSGEAKLGGKLTDVLQGTTAITKYYTKGEKNAMGLYEVSPEGKLGQLMVNGYYGGQDVHVETVKDRLMELRTEHLMPGDVLVKLEKSIAVYCVYLGGGKFLTNSTKDEPATAPVIAGQEVLTDCFKETYKFFFLTRPMQLMSAAEIPG